MSSELYKITWEQYGMLVEDLWKDLQSKLSENQITIHAIVAILREGAFTAIPLAYKLNTYKILTIQYKYTLNGEDQELMKIADLSESNIDIPNNPVFLLCDTFPCGGRTKFLAVEDIKAKYPRAKFVFASLVQDSSVENHEDFLAAAYAFDVNENWETRHPLFERLGIEKNALDVVLPWENAAEEKAAIHKQVWEYN